MKKQFSVLAAGVLALAMLPACQRSAKKADTLSIVTTIFPEYDWVMNILGDNLAKAEVTMLLNNGVDLHSFQPTAQDILKISECDLFIYVGGESDEWVEDALKTATNKDMVVIDLLDVLGDRVKEEELVEGMEGDEEEAGEEEEEGPEYDEHVWLSLRNAAFLVEEISQSIQSIDKTHASVYQDNTKKYVDALKALDTEYASVVSEGRVDTLLFGDRFPFRYLVDDYGLNYYAAFVGCSAETEASFQTIMFLSEKVDELSLSHIMTIEGANHKIAETIVENTTAKDQTILTLDSMQSVTSKDVEEGVTYLSIMEKNLDVLKEALQ